jgi:hypothetical protein
MSDVNLFIKPNLKIFLFSKMSNQRFLLPGSIKPVHPFYDKLRKYQEGIKIDKFSDFERSISSNREFRLRKLRSGSHNPPPNKNEVIENIHNKMSRKHRLDGGIEKFIFRNKPFYGPEYSHIPTVTEAEEGTNYRYYMQAAAELLGMSSFVNPGRSKYSKVSSKVQTKRSSSPRKTDRQEQQRMLKREDSSGQETMKGEELSQQRSRATVTEARSNEENEITDRDINKMEEQRKVFFQDPSALKKLSEYFLKSRRGSINSSEATHIIKPANPAKDEFPLLEGMLERGAVPVPPEYDIDDSTRYKYIYQKLKNANERVKLGLEIKPKTPPKPRNPEDRQQIAKNLVTAKKDSLPLIFESGESPIHKKMAEYSTFDNSGLKPKSADLSTTRQRRNQVIKLNEKFQNLKTEMTRAFGEVKDKNMMKKLEQNCNKINKTYDNLDRRLNRQKPHLYDFEDYLNCVYGDEYSIDEYAVALKARPLEVDKHELGDLIKQVQLEKYNF